MVEERGHCGAMTRAMDVGKRPLCAEDVPLSLASRSVAGGGGLAAGEARMLGRGRGRGDAIVDT